MTKTTAQKLEAARALVAKYEQQLDSETILNNIEVGDDVSFKFGRGEKARVLEGSVVAVGEVERLGLVAAVQSGEGIDVQTYKVRVLDITENRTAATRDPAAFGGATATDAADPLEAAE